jgi:hypothetical protein
MEEIQTLNLDEILDTIVSYDATKPWEVVIYQFILYCFRNFCLQRILKSFDTAQLPDIDWDTIYELCEKYCDPSFKPHLIDFFTPAHFQQIEDTELIEIFLHEFTTSLDNLLVKEDTILQESFVKFLDETIFIYFKNLLKDSELYIFPETIDDTMNIDIYMKFRTKEFDFISKGMQYEVINDIIEFTKESSKKSLGHALRLKKFGFSKTLKHKKISQSKTLRNK